jgi:hypothetical protein
MNRIILSAVLFCASIVPVFASDFAPAVDLSGRLTYPSVVSNEKSPETKLSGSADLASSCMFNTDLLPNLWFIPTLTADYSNTAQPLNIADERFLFAEWLDLYASYGVNYDLGKEWEVKARGFVRTDFSKQTADEKTGLGLYDYIDNGFYLENYNEFLSWNANNRLTEGVKYLDRRFRNYNTLLSESASVTTTPNNYTKELDTLIYSAYIGDEVEFGKSGWSLLVNFNYDYLPYSQQKLIWADGSLEALRRVDRTGKLSIDLPYYGDNKSGVEFQYDFIKNVSNQNYYDTMGTTDMSDDVYTKGYYDFVENTGKFSVTYEFPWKFFSAYSPLAVISFSLDLVSYENRIAKDASGAYTAKKQQDNNYTVGLDLKQNISEWWNWLFNIDYTRYNSNMKYEALGLYNYAYITVSLGSGISF